MGNLFASMFRSTEPLPASVSAGLARNTDEEEALRSLGQRLSDLISITGVLAAFDTHVFRHADAQLDLSTSRTSVARRGTGRNADSSHGMSVDGGLSGRILPVSGGVDAQRAAAAEGADQRACGASYLIDQECSKKILARAVVHKADMRLSTDATGGCRTALSSRRARALPAINPHSDHD